MAGKATATALAYLRAGLSLIPISQGGSKRPEGRLLPVVWDDEQGRSVSTWAPFQTALPTEEQVREWFDRSPTPGIGIIGGNVSGGLETIDFDAGLADPYPEWCALVEAARPGLIERLNVCRTPRKPINGHHVRYRVRGFEVPGNQPLAREPDPEKPGKLRTLIETRGTGGYALAPGSPPECHETGGIYEHVSGPPLTVLPVISIAERNVLIDCARALTVSIGESDLGVNDLRHASGNKPGADFNRRVSWSDVLDRHGWRLVRQSGNVCYWRRPGKDEGWSATTGRCYTEQQGDLLYVFSSNADPFQATKGYSKFAAYALLEHGGDFGRAAAELGRNGYGDPPARPSEVGNLPPHRNGRTAAGPRGLPDFPDIPDIPDVSEDWGEAIPLAAEVPPEPFPVDVLPGICRELVEEAADALPAPRDYIAVPMLGVAGAAIGGSRVLSIKEGYTESPLLYLSVVGEPGTAKTPALDLLTRPATDAEIADRERWDAEKEEYDRKMEEHREAKKKKDGLVNEKPERPILKRCRVSDATVESLAPILLENPRGLLLERDELIGWLESMNQYKAGGRGGDRQFWLQTWSRTTVTIDRKGDRDRGQIIVPHPFVAIVGGMTPSKLRTLRGDRGANRGDDDGFLDRILFAYPQTIPEGEEEWKVTSRRARDGWARVWNALNGLEMVTDTKRPRAAVIELDDLAKQEYAAFRRDHGCELRSSDFPPHLRGPWAKLRGYWGRFALIAHYLRWACGEVQGDTAPVDRESARRATLLVNYFKAHARRVHAALDADTRLEGAQRIWKWIAENRRSEFRPWEAHENMRRHHCFKLITSLDAPLTLLSNHSLIRLRPAIPRGGRGRPSGPVYEVNPAAIASGYFRQLRCHPDNPVNPVNTPADAPREARCTSYPDLPDYPDGREVVE